MSRRDAERAKAQFSSSLMRKAGVHGVAPGKKIIKGEVTDIDCVTVFVTKKMSVHSLASKDIVPRSLGSADVPTDVIELAHVQAVRRLFEPNFIRDKIGGTSIGEEFITAGTAGVLVVDATTGALGILSNNHVLARTNKASIGARIMWPGPFDNAGVLEHVANLKRFIHIYMIGETGPNEPPPQPAGCTPVAAVLRLLRKRARMQSEPYHNRIDAAFATLLPGASFKSGIERIGIVRGQIDEPAPGLAVHKYGRTTEYTEGTILYTNAMIDVGYGSHGAARFDGQIVISPGTFSGGGDSGSLVLHGNEAVALLFAGNDEVTIASPIAEVMARLQCVWQVL